MVPVVVFLVAKMAHTHHHPNKLFIHTCQLKVLSIRQVLISFVTVPNPPPLESNFLGWLDLHQVCC